MHRHRRCDVMCNGSIYNKCIFILLLLINQISSQCTTDEKTRTTCSMDMYTYATYMHTLYVTTTNLISCLKSPCVIPVLGGKGHVFTYIEIYLFIYLFILQDLPYTQT
jgi:hypothetical protein